MRGAERELLCFVLGELRNNFGGDALGPRTGRCTARHQCACLHKADEKAVGTVSRASCICMLNYFQYTKRKARNSDVRILTYFDEFLMRLGSQRD